ncbi:hypothetical protein AN644_03635 [Candidatus Epulonipiscium fishelsonii]|nr:hypothetical protein AN644_03635 [Epulopiscium sp. SCG-C06WGA-EpuloA1]
MIQSIKRQCIDSLDKYNKLVNTTIRYEILHLVLIAGIYGVGIATLINIIFGYPFYLLSQPIGLALFIFMVFKLTAPKVKYIEYLSSCVDEIANGNLECDIEVEGFDELAQLAINIDTMQQKLKFQIEQREESEKIKNDLVTNVAHDLRTPLTSIIGYMGLIKNEQYETKEDEKKYLDVAFCKAEKLKLLIEDLFEYTKLTNQKVKLKKERVSMALFVNQLVEEFIPQVEENNLNIVCDVRTPESFVDVDMNKMARVFENLIENAIKYSLPNETIQIIIQLKDGYIYTSVRNKTNNLEEKDLARLFNRFYRTDSSRNSKTGGSGLGLAITKNIVETHNGKIWVQLDGNIVTFTVKIKQHIS